jgi:phage-related protein
MVQGDLPFEDRKQDLRVALLEKESRKTDRRDIAIASQRLKLARQRLKEQKSHEKRSGK